MIPEIWAIVVGVVSGIVATIPTSLLMLVILTRQSQPHARPHRLGDPSADYPPIVIIQRAPTPVYRLPEEAGR